MSWLEVEAHSLRQVRLNANVEAEELSQSVVNVGQSQGPASLPLQPFTDQAQSSVCQREPSRPVCHRFIICLHVNNNNMRLYLTRYLS